MSSCAIVYRQDMALQQQQQQQDRPGSAGSCEQVGRGSKAWQAQTAELHQLKAELAAAQDRLRDAGTCLAASCSALLV